MPKYDPQRHHRRSIRLRGYDYTQPGAYFITLVTQLREAIFGEFSIPLDAAFFPAAQRKNAQHTGNATPVQYTRAGEIVLACWRQIPNHFPFVQLDEFVIMPDHFHGILWILDENTQPQGDLHLGRKLTFAQDSPQPPKGTQPRSLNAILQNFKSVSTRKINQAMESPGNKIWQRNYYERVIRNEKELNAIREYIQSNPYQHR